MKYIKSPTVKLFLLLSITLASFGLLIVDSIKLNTSTDNFPQAKQGVLDLRNWDFNRDGLVNLSGQWEFYNNQLLNPKDFYQYSPGKKEYSTIPGIFATQGYGTYRLKVLINNSADIYSIKIDYIQSAYKLWINNTFTMGNGKVGKSKNDMIPQLLPKIGIVNPNSKEFYITLQVSNYYSKIGFIDNIIMGDSDKISSYRDKKLAFDLFILGSTFIAAVYNLGVFIKRPKDKAPLYFSIVCLLIALRTVFIGERFLTMLFPDFSYMISVKIMILTFYVYVPFIVLFINKCYGEILSKLLVRVSTVSAVIYSLIVIISPIKYYLVYILPFEALAIMMLSYMIIKIFKTYTLSGQSDYIALVGIFALLIARINDILYEYSIILSTSLAPLGTLVFIIVNYYVLAGRQSNAFNSLETASEKLESLNKLKDDFLAVTSHELKTPLSGIIGLSEGIIRGNNNLNEQEKNTMHLINLSVKRLSNLVDDILVFSNIRNNNLKLYKKATNISTVVDSVIKFLSISANNKQIRILNFIDDEAPYVLADEDRLHQILYNLISNAIKFTYKGDVVISYKITDGYIYVSVKDHGIGIQPKKLNDIFDLYEQGDGISANYGGTGIGLYITKQLVRLHGGSITVFSNVGEGSKFTFSLPLCKSEPMDAYQKDDKSISANSHIAFTSAPVNENHYYKADSETEGNIYSSLENLNTYKILIVDDEYVNQKVLESYLAELSPTILKAFNGKEALNIIHENNDIDLAIIDMMMPDLLGYEVAEKIREKKTIFELPILIMTADRRIESLVSSFECGANDYLTKPFDKSELLARVTTLLTLKSKVNEAVNLSHQVIAANNEVKSLNKQNAENSRKMEELMEYDKIKTEFFTNISHELRTPLNVISSTIQLLNSLDKDITLGDDKIKYYLSIMNQNSLRLLRLINNIIDTTKIDGGYLGLNLTNGNIIYVIEEICQSVTDYINTKNIDIIFDTDVEEKIMAYDEEKIERIILNILSNAVKFTGKDGSIFVNIYDKGDIIEVRIRDTGIGIPADKIDYIFERFAQVDKSITRQNEGSGIGLSLVKSLVEMHGGTINAVSEINVGSEFILTFPVKILDEIEEKNSITYKQIKDQSDSKYDKNLSVEFSDIYL